MAYPEPFDRLIRVLGKLPGLGRRSAERIALGLIKNRNNVSNQLLAALQQVQEEVRLCGTCGALTPVDADPCRYCTDTRRDGALICVVEDPADIELIERTGEYRGRYHALLGKISPADDSGVQDIRTAALLKRARARGVREVILALNSDVESAATASYLSDVLEQAGVRVSRLAFGLPAGSGIAYSDPITLSRAMKGRQSVR